MDRITVTWSDDESGDPNSPTDPEFDVAAFMLALSRFSIVAVGGDFADEHELRDEDIEASIRRAAVKAEDWVTAYGRMDQDKIADYRRYVEDGRFFVVTYP